MTEGDTRKGPSVPWHLAKTLIPAGIHAKALIPAGIPSTDFHFPSLPVLSGSLISSCPILASPLHSFSTVRSATYHNTGGPTSSQDLQDLHFLQYPCALRIAYLSPSFDYLSLPAHKGTIHSPAFVPLLIVWQRRLTRKALLPPCVDITTRCAP